MYGQNTTGVGLSENAFVSLASNKSDIKGHFLLGAMELLSADIPLIVGYP